MAQKPALSTPTLGFVGAGSAKNVELRGRFQCWGVVISRKRADRLGAYSWPGSERGNGN